MTPIPVALLTDWRSPDRDLYRVLTVRGPLPVSVLAGSLSISRMATRNALDRMYRLGVVSYERSGTAPKAGMVWRVDYAQSQMEHADGITRRKRAA